MKRSAYQWLQTLSLFCHRYWIPVLLGIISTIAVLGLWQQLRTQEHRHIQQLVQQEADSIQVELNRELSSRMLGLQRIARRWQESGGTPKPLWEADVTDYIEHYYGYQAIEWVDSTFHVQWIVPLKGNEAAQNLDLGQERRRHLTLRVARDLQQTILSRTISLAQGGRGFLACVPIFIKSHDGAAGVDRFDGFIVGVFRFQSLFDSILRASPRYKVQIYDSAGLIYSQKEIPASSFTQTAVVQAYGADWRLQIVPTSALIAAGRSPLPNLVLWGGLMGAWALAFVVYLGQRAERYARQARKINRQLQDEVTYRQQIETSLRASEERWQLVLRGNNDGIWDWNVQTNEVFFSSRLKEMLGFADHEISNHLDEWWKRVHPDDLGWVMDAVQDHFAKRTSFYSTEYRVQCKDGSYKWILDRGQALWDDAGNVMRMVGSHKDITGRKQAEAALEKELLRSTALLNTSLDGIVVLDHQGNVVQTSPSFAQMLGYTVAETLTLNVADWDAQWTREELQQMRNRNDLFPLFETCHRRKDGSLYNVEISYSRMELDGEMMHFCICRDISDRKCIEAERQQTEQALRESEARFQAFMNYSPAFAWITDASGTMLYASQTYLQTFQLPPGDVIGKSIFELYPAEIARQYLRNIQTVAETREVLQTTEVALYQDGTMGDFLVYKFPIPDASGQTFIGGMAIDITQQHRVEAALRQSEATKQAIIQAIPDLLIRMHADGRYIEFISNRKFNIVNPEYRRYDTNVCNILPPDLAQLRLHYAQQALQSDAIQLYEHEIWIKGKQCYEEVRIVPLLQDEVLVMVRDITDRKQTEEELRHQKEMFQAIVDHIPMMIALFNSQGQIDFINPEFERTLGWSLEACQQQNVLAECYPDSTDYQRVLDHMLAANSRWQDLTTLTASKHPLETTWTNVQLSSGRFLGIGQDISDRKHKELALRQAMEAAEAANLAKSIFLANMSHELRTPLNVILGFTQVMAHDPSLTANQQADLQTIRRSGDHLLSLINDVLDLSKIEAGHCTLEETEFDLIALLHALRSMMAERANSKQLQLEFEIAPDIPQFVIADEQKLRQILLNLLSNAIKFTEQGGVTLRVLLVNSHASSGGPFEYSPNTRGAMSNDPKQLILQFAVIDTGIGIAATEQAMIFDAFVQAKAGKKSINGTGLGLTISRKLLELMNGTISVHSIPTVGSTFTFMIPVYPISGVHVHPEQSARMVIGLASGQPNRRILVVDDQQENRLLLVRLLTQLGLETRQATNGQDAIEIWQTWQPDLIWMDIRMPEIDGYEATKQIRALEKRRSGDAGAGDEVLSSSPIIIALTAQASQSDRALALAAGCNDYISKPFREETLLLKLKEYLSLEYLYADATSQSESQLTPSSCNCKHSANLVNPALVASLPTEWLQALDNATVCGNDRTIVELAAHLPPELVELRTRLIELAENYQFEQILQLIHGISSS